MMKILFTGGGTAGHIFPIISIVREIKERYPNKKLKFYYLGPKDKFADSLLSQEGIIVKTILAGKLRRYFSFKNIIDIFLKFPLGFFQAFFYIFIISPDVIFSKGGYGSLPAVLAGKLLFTPIFLHESDVVPGLANKIAGKLALEIFTAFPLKNIKYFSPKKILAVGNPIRKEILLGKETEAKKLLGITGEKPVILVLGGSQGAQIINDRILVVLDKLLKNFEIIHQTGKNNFEQIKKEAEVVIPKGLKKYYHPFGFLNEKELATAYACCSLVISRAGAGAIFEISAAGRPAILVPLEGSAQDHQLMNAYVYAESGAAVVMEEENFTPHFLVERLKFLFSKPNKLKKMAKQAKEFSKPEAGRIIAEYLMTYLTQ